MAQSEGREPLRHVKWWVWFIPTVILLAILLYAVKSYRTPMERAAVSAAPWAAPAPALLA